MAGITVDIAQAELDRWVAASQALATSQSYKITNRDGSSRELERPDLPEVLKMIDFWQGKLNQLSRTRGRTRYVVPS